MIDSKLKQTVAALASIALLAYITANACAYFPTGDIFELRPSRVRTAAPDESTNRWHNFSLAELIPRSIPQEVFILTEPESFVVVFPARNWGNSDRSIYSVHSKTIDGFNITLDYYIFSHPFSGALDSFSPPSEQIVPIGTLPDGDYVFNVRRWFLNYDDRLGFDESEVERWSAPDEGGFYTVPERYRTDDQFTFSIATNIVPEPASLAMLVIGMFFFNTHKRSGRQITKRCTGAGSASRVRFAHQRLLAAR